MTALSDKSRSAIPGAALGPAGVGAPLQSNDADRLEALRRLGILDTPPEAVFDALTQIAAFATGTPIALISLVDETRQWFKSRVGLQASETPREHAFCAHAILRPGEPMTVEDATRDARFAANPLVTGDPSIRFYAGFPLTLRGGATVGTLCVIDREPRQLSAEQIRMLDTLARLAVSALDAHGETMAQQATIKLTNERLQVALEASGVSTWDSDLRSGVVTLSAGWAALIGDPPGETRTTMQDLMALAHPDDLDQAVRLSTETLRGLREEYSEEHRVRTRAGDWRWVLSRGKVLERDAGGRAMRMIGSNVDITERKQREAALAESEARLRSQFSLSTEFYWETDAGHRMTERTDNPGIPQSRFPEHTGDWRGKTRWEVPFVAPDAAGWQGHRQVLDARLPFRDFEFSRPERDGPVRHFVISGEPRLDAQGKFLGYRGVGSDITARKSTEVALGRTLSRLELALEASHVCTWDYDLVTDAVVLSESWAEITGQPAGATRTTFQALAAMVHPEDIARLRTVLMDTVKGKCEEYALEHRVRHRGGEWRWIISRGKVILRDAAGRALRMIGSNIDITERKAAEESLRTHERELRLVMDSIPVMIARSDRDERLVFVNRRYCELMDRPASQLMGRTIAEVVAPEVYALAKPWIDRVLAGEPVAFERRQMRPNGEVLDLEVRYVPDLDDRGRVLGWFGMHSDITGGKHAKEALAESEERFRTIFERSDAGITLWDLAGVYISVNAAFTRFTGYGAEELVGRMTARDLLHPDDVNQQDISGRLTANSVGHFRRDQRYRCKDGRTVWGRVALALVRDAQGQPRYYIEVVSNITGARKAREKIERMNAELEERVAARTEDLRAANKELEAFAYSVSHDLRAPIGAINGFASLLRMNKDDRLTDDSRKLLCFIESNAARMAELVDAMLALSRIGQKAMTIRRVPMQDLVKNILAESDAAQRADIRLDALPECQGDPLLLRQVWVNLIGNAFKYSRQRDPARIEIGYDAETGAYFVRDNGAGFDMQHAGKLFGAFERLHSDAEFEGTGIGLAIVERIVQRHGGRTWAEAAPEAGATFWFTVQD